MRGQTVKSPEVLAEARRLRDQGMLLRGIAERFGVSVKTVHAWLTDPDGSALRARKDSYAGVCVECGGWVSGHAGRNGRSLRCTTCGSCLGGVRGGRTVAARALPRRERIAVLYRQGMPLAEIAREVGTTVDSLGVTLVRMRRAGWDLPYRRKPRVTA